jgi:dTDP-4-dehydrorhamnose 3,5-epimerase
MKATPTPTLPDVLVVEPQVFGDARGFFMETYHAEKFASLGLPTRWVQDNHSRSARDILRGLHYQLQQTQGKLVRCVAGAIFDVAVDLRRSSPTFGQWAGVTLSAENKAMLWVPEGFAHGFLSLEDGTEVTYKCTDLYLPAAERSVLWNDPAIGIDWPDLGVAPLLSAKDAAGLPLSAAEVFP